MMSGEDAAPFSVNLYIFYGAWIKDRLSTFGHTRRGFRLRPLPPALREGDSAVHGGLLTRFGVALGPQARNLEPSRGQIDRGAGATCSAWRLKGEPEMQRLLALAATG